MGEEGRRAAILGAAVAEFSRGYDKASTDAIVKAAGVSKGLLFHHFGSKKELFFCAYEYAIGLVIAEFYDLVNLEQRDILERWRQIALLKMDLMREHPMIFAFIASASFPDGGKVKESVLRQRQKLEAELYPNLFYDVDRSLFREDVDVDTAIHVILYTIEGYAQAQADPAKSSQDYYGEYPRYLADLEHYIAFFRRQFYRKEGVQ